MAGIEVVGIVLGALPLVISGLEHYGEGVRKIKSVLDYPGEFAALSRKLRVENEVFRNTMELILCDCAEGSAIASLLADPGGDEWSGKKVQQALKSRLQGSYSVFLETVVSMNNSLLGFISRLRLGADGKGPFTNPKSFREAYQRFRFALNKSAYMDLVDAISKDNTALQRLTEQSAVLEPSRSRRKRPNLNSFRAQASSLFASIRGAIQASCTAAHMACIQLENPGRAASHSWQDRSEGDAVRIVLHHQDASDRNALWTCNEAEFRLLKSTEVKSVIVPEPKTRKPRIRFAEDTRQAIPTKPQTFCPQQVVEMVEIRDLCGSFPKMQKRKCGAYLGYLTDSSGSMRHGLYSPSRPLLGHEKPNFVSLEDMLGKKAISRLSVANRRRLAAALALKIIQLYDTPWLRKEWGRREIVFFQEESQILADHPFLSTSLAATDAENGRAQSFLSSRKALHDCLFAFGILLIELCLNEPFDTLLDPKELSPDSVGHAAIDRTVALRLADAADDEASWRYGNAIRYCIQFASERRNASLDDNEFREAAYDNVVMVLQEEADQFSRPGQIIS